MKKLKTIALKAREISEQRAKEADFPSNLEGFCARGSTILFRLLRSEGYLPKFGVSLKRPHVFVIVGDKIVDVTASQYQSSSSSKVFIVKQPSKKSQYQVDRVINSIDELVEFQRSVDWADSQIPEKTYD